VSKAAGPEADVLTCMYDFGLIFQKDDKWQPEGLHFEKDGGMWKLVDTRTPHIIEAYGGSGSSPHFGQRRLSNAVRSLRSKDLVTRCDEEVRAESGELIRVKYRFLLTEKGRLKAVRLIPRGELLALAGH
jgi:hypothetical protein